MSLSDAALSLIWFSGLLVGFAIGYAVRAYFE